MAGQPRAFVLLFGMGLRSFSMSSAFVPSIKELASRITVAQAESILQRALELNTTSKVKRFMADRLQEISPELRLLDTA
jgi:phosphoenolpyruvate-protein kinase (PTS system EI component)